jgi:hypothetical protein
MAELACGTMAIRVALLPQVERRILSLRKTDSRLRRMGKRLNPQVRILPLQTRFRAGHPSPAECGTYLLVLP